MKLIEFMGSSSSGYEQQWDSPLQRGILQRASRMGTAGAGQ